MGAVALDAGVLIGALNSNDTWHEAASRYVRTLRPHQALVSAVAYAECLIKPNAEGVADRVEAVLMELVTVASIDAETASLAAQIRAQDKVALPDALVIASAVTSRAAALVTTDRRVAATTRIPTINLTLSE